MSRRARGGVSLVEVLVAAAVLVVALLPLFVLFSGSLRKTEVSIDELRAVDLAQELLVQIRGLAVVPGFPKIPDMPSPNPPPDHPLWLAIHDPASGFHQLGASLPHPVGGTAPQAVSLDTRDWTLLGAPGCRLPPPATDPLDEALSRIWLSAAPQGYRRFLRVYRPRINARGDVNPNLLRIDVRVEWDRTFMGAPTQTRTVALSTLVGSPVLP